MEDDSSSSSMPCDRCGLALRYPVYITLLPFTSGLPTLKTLLLPTLSSQTGRLTAGSEYVWELSLAHARQQSIISVGFFNGLKDCVAIDYALPGNPHLEAPDFSM